MARTLVGWQDAHYLLNTTTNRPLVNTPIDVQDLATGAPVTDLQPPTGYDGQPFPAGQARSDGDGYYGFTVAEGQGPVRVRVAADPSRNLAAGQWLTPVGQALVNGALLGRGEASNTYGRKADLDALTLAAVTTEELFINATFETGTISSSRSYGLFVAPYALRVASLSLWQWDGPGSIPLDASNYWIVTLDRSRGGASANIAARSTQLGPANNEAWVKRADWNWDTVAFNANRDLQKGDVVSIGFNMVGAPGQPVKVGATLRCEPL